MLQGYVGFPLDDRGIIHIMPPIAQQVGLSF